MRNTITLLALLLVGSLSLTTAKAQDKEDFKIYNRSSKHIVIYDAITLQPTDSVPVREVLEINSNTPIDEQSIQNSEVFYLMEEEELMREQRPQ